MKEQKYHIYLTEQERSEVIKSLIDLKNTLIRQGKYTDAVDVCAGEADRRKAKKAEGRIHLNRVRAAYSQSE